MSFMEELRSQRQKFLEGLMANQGDINLDIFEDFYPDKAHFVFELLQNAEDTGATKCIFNLTEEQLEFRHNGSRTFDERDIRSITGIHNSTKTKSTESIGKFGVGFKSVFIYTLTPQIHSGEYSFSINNLVMPEIIEKHPDLGNDTVFCFPFNNPEKKTADEAYAEIKQGLEKLSELTLLFLKNIESISWTIEGHSESHLYRVRHSEFHIEVIKELYGIAQSKSNFLRFIQPAQNHVSQHVCLAFPLIQIDESLEFNRDKSLSEQFKITPANPGRVSVFFPAEKEASGLRFHIHAPFIPTLDRSSVKDTAVNDPLFAQIASFTAETLHDIRKLGLLTPGFLRVLPNPDDNLTHRYEPIRTAIVDEMNQKELTPKRGGGHAPARRLIQAKQGSKDLKELLDETDLELLVDYEEESPLWAVASNQKNNLVDKFLSSLEIENWGVEDLVSWLTTHFDITNMTYSITKRGKHDEWLISKSNEWFQKFYSILYRECFARGRPNKFKELRIIKLTNGKLSDARECLFVDNEYPADDLAKWVSKELFSSGESLNEKQDSYSFLEAMGVRKVGESERVELLLKSRYKKGSFNPLIEDMNLFLQHVAKIPDDLELFREAAVFKCEDGKWRIASKIYIDEPYSSTGLNEVYGVNGDRSRHPLSSDYLNLQSEITKTLREFAVKLGAVSNLEISEVSCVNNRHWPQLSDSTGQKTNRSVDRDFFIKGFEDIFQLCSESMSQIVWDTLCDAEEDRLMSRYLVATFQRNNKRETHRQDKSQLVYQLMETAWVPQQGGSPVAPPYADPNLLPPGFVFEPDWKWVEAVRFGSHLASRIEAQEREDEILRKSLGIHDKQSLEEIRELVKLFAKLPSERRRKHIDEAQQELDFELPVNEPKNPELRGQRVGEAAKDAAERASEIRDRSVAIGREEIRTSAKQYLKQQYSNEDHVMICQVCQNELPFKLAHGGYYFEAVDFVDGLKLRHDQNYVALCPNHAAMFKHANNSKHELKNLFLQMNSDRRIQIDLAGKIHSMLFTETHKVDLAAVIKSESSSPPMS